jgi:GNAT superfamily N-acetyltransferase
MLVRAAEDSELEALARLWWAGWHDAHAAIAPADLTRLRTLNSFRERTRGILPGVRTTGPAGGPIGLHYLKGDELNQFYLAAEARGAGVAGPLMADAEAQLTARGVKTAWLDCAIGNLRAARFYEKAGWRQAAGMAIPTETSAGSYRLHVWRYEKSLAT